MRFSAWRTHLMLAPFMVSSFAHAKEEAVSPGPLNIKLVIPSSVSDLDKKQIGAHWKQACASLGAAFTVKKNFFHHGIASSYTCDAASSADAKPQEIRSGWTLQITLDQGTSTIAMFYRNGATPEAKVVIATDAKIVKALRNLDVARHTAMVLMDDLPFARLVDGQSVKNSLSYTRENTDTNLVPMEKYTLFSMTYSSETNAWIPKVIGKVVLDEKSHPVANKNASPSNKGTPASAGRETWRWKVALSNPLTKNKVYWAQDARGRGANREALGEILKKELRKHGIEGSLVEDLLATFKTGYAGIRYGYPVVSGDSLVTKSAMIGILAEIRGGPLEGLRWYWDFAPEVSEKVQDHEMSFSWSRASLGWSFGFDVNHKFLNRLM